MGDDLRDYFPFAKSLGPETARLAFVSCAVLKPREGEGNRRQGCGGKEGGGGERAGGVDVRQRNFGKELFPETGFLEAQADDKKD